MICYKSDICTNIPHVFDSNQLLVSASSVGLKYMLIRNHNFIFKNLNEACFIDMEGMKT